LAGEGVLCFGEVEFVFELAKNVVTDSAVIAEMDGGLALDAGEFANEIDAAGEGGGTMRGGAVLFGAFEALAIEVEHFLVDGGKILMIEGAFFLEVVDRRFEHKGASLRLFTIGSFGAGEAESADQRRKSESLKDERYKNYGKGEEENQVAVGEGAAVSQSERQRKGSSQGDDTAHSGPAHYENLLVAGHAHVLVKKAVADKVGDPGSRVHPKETKNDQYGAESEAVFHEFDKTETVNFPENVR